MNDPFFAEILRNPEDMDLRMVYADWLEEHGDTRGEFIRVQVALAAGSLSDANREELQQRERDLYARHHRDWNGIAHRFLLNTGLRHGVGRRRPIRHWRYHRGLIENLRVESPAFVNYEDVLFQLGPLTGVTIIRANVASLSPILRRSREFSRLQRVKFVDARIDMDVAARLVAACQAEQAPQVLFHSDWIEPGVRDLLATSERIKILGSGAQVG